MTHCPLHIALSTVGSTGDIQPFIALGKTLMAAGHQVKAITHPFHRDRFEAHGIPFHGCGPEVELEELNALLSRMLLRVNPIKQLRMLMEEAFFEDFRQYFEDAKAGLADVDLVVGHMVDFVGQEAASQLGKPRIGVVLAPGAIPTQYNFPMLPVDWGPRWNKFAWWVMGILMGRLDHDIIARLRMLGGTRQHISRYHTLSPDLNLIASSPILTPIYPDLPDQFNVTGAWILPEPSFTPPPDLVAFLEKYPRPVVVSFGSMGGEKGPELTKTVLEALEKVGAAGIIQSGYAGLFEENAPENVHFAEYVPHGWLFEQGSCVVHHGGAGTTMAACRAGVPSVVVTFIADQPYFASNLRRLGIAPKMTWFRWLNADVLAERLREVLNQPTFFQTAQQLRPQFRAEKGTERAVEAIENFARSINFN